MKADNNQESFNEGLNVYTVRCTFKVQKKSVASQIKTENIIRPTLDQNNGTAMKSQNESKITKNKATKRKRT